MAPALHTPKKKPVKVAEVASPSLIPPKAQAAIPQPPIANLSPISFRSPPPLSTPKLSLPGSALLSPPPPPVGGILDIPPVELLNTSAVVSPIEGKEKEVEKKKKEEVKKKEEEKKEEVDKKEKEKMDMEEGKKKEEVEKKDMEEEKKKEEAEKEEKKEETEKEEKKEEAEKEEKMEEAEKEGVEKEEKKEEVEKEEKKEEAEMEEVEKKEVEEKKEEEEEKKEVVEKKEEEEKKEEDTALRQAVPHSLAPQETIVMAEEPIFDDAMITDGSEFKEDDLDDENEEDYQLAMDEKDFEERNRTEQPIPPAVTSSSSAPLKDPAQMTQAELDQHLLDAVEKAKEAEIKMTERLEIRAKALEDDTLKLSLPEPSASEDPTAQFSHLFDMTPARAPDAMPASPPTSKYQTRQRKRGKAAEPPALSELPEPGSDEEIPDALPKKKPRRRQEAKEKAPRAPRAPKTPKEKKRGGGRLFIFLIFFW